VDLSTDVITIAFETIRPGDLIDVCGQAVKVDEIVERWGQTFVRCRFGEFDLSCCRLYRATEAQ